MARRTKRLLVAVLVAQAGIAAWGETPLPTPADGYLCCNMHVEDGWISDINPRSKEAQLLPAGTPIKALGYGRHRVKVSVAGRPMELGNDYSRKVDLRSFAQRYILAEDPTQALQSYAPEVRDAIQSGRLVPGMTREQVLMSAGYPVADSTPDLSAVVWKYFVDSERPFEVVFDPEGKVLAVRGEDAALAVVAPSLLTAERLAQATAGERACSLNVYYAAAKHWNVPRNRVYVYVDERSLGTMGRGDTLCVDLPPGRHTLALRETFNFIPMPFKSQEHVFDMKEGQAPIYMRWEMTVVGVVVVGPGAGTPELARSFEPVTEAQWRNRD